MRIAANRNLHLQIVEEYICIVSWTELLHMHVHFKDNQDDIVLVENRKLTATDLPKPIISYLVYLFYFS